jgi:hypothetical protein
MYRRDQREREFHKLGKLSIRAFRKPRLKPDDSELWERDGGINE